MEALIWPVTVIVIVLFFFVIFFKPISALIAKATRVGYGNKAVEFAAPQIGASEQQRESIQKSDELASTPEDTLPGPPPEALAPIENEILAALKAINASDEVKRAWLVRALATIRLAKSHETNYRLIIGSQINLLLRANTLATLTIPDARAIYDAADAAHPDFLKEFSFDNWLAWPVNAGLLKLEQTGPDRSAVRITPVGQDFLHYLVASNLTAPKYG